MVLHHIVDDPKLIELSTTNLGSKRLLEGEGYTGYAVSIPGGSKDHVAKPEADEVLDHLLAQVVVNPVQLLLREQFLHMVTQFSIAGRILDKRFLQNNSGLARGGYPSSLEGRSKLAY